MAVPSPTIRSPSLASMVLYTVCTLVQICLDKVCTKIDKISHVLLSGHSGCPSKKSKIQISTVFSGKFYLYFKLIILSSVSHPISGMYSPPNVCTNTQKCAHVCTVCTVQSVQLCHCSGQPADFSSSTDNLILLVLEKSLGCIDDLWMKWGRTSPLEAGPRCPGHGGLAYRPCRPMAGRDRLRKWGRKFPRLKPAHAAMTAVTGCGRPWPPWPGLCGRDRP